MPDAHQQEDQNVAQRRGQRAGDVRAQARFGRLGEPGHGPGQREGIEDIVAHPRAQGDVPPAPEVAQGDGEVGTFEVGRKADAEQLRDAGDQVDAAGEVAVLLQRVKQHGHDDHRAAVRLLPAEHRADQRERAVGDDLLFEEAPEHEQRAALDVCNVEAVRRLQLGGELIKARDRALNQLREEGDEQRKLRRVPLRRVFAVVHVDQIAHRLERVKRDAQRQHQRKRRTSHGRQQRRGVLEQREHAEVEQQHGIKDRALAAFGLRLERLFARRVQFGPAGLERRLALLADAADAKRARPGGQRRQQDERQRVCAAIGVIRIACQQQEHPLHAVRAQVVQRRAQEGECNQGKE